MKYLLMLSKPTKLVSGIFMKTIIIILLASKANAQIEVIKKLETKILHETIFIQKIDDILKKLDQ